MFQVSVIIPVYNAVNFIERAVESIIHQDKVGEVILIDDGFPDGALEICKNLEKKYNKIKVFQHPNGENLGAGASRNLGMKIASCPYIAFLDADDFCLPERFKKTAIAFKQNEAITAVYEPVGTAYLNEEAKRDFCRWRKITKSEAETYLTYVNKEVEGREFLISLLKGNNGSPCTVGITLKKSAIQDMLWFNSSLTLHQDSEFWVRLAYYGYFAPVENATPIGMRYVHLENRISKRSFHSILKKEKVLFNWAKKEINDPLIYRLILKRYIYSLFQSKLNSANIFALSICKIFYTFAIIVNPKSWK